MPKRYPIWFWNEIQAVEDAARLVANGDTTAIRRLISALAALDHARAADEADTRRMLA